MGTVSNQRGLVHLPKTEISCQVGGRVAGGALFCSMVHGTVRTKIGMRSGVRGGERGEGSREKGGRVDADEQPCAKLQGGVRFRISPKNNNRQRW